MSINSRHQPSSTVKALFAGAMTKVKTEAAEAIAKVKAEAVEKAREYTDTISRIKAEAEEAIAKEKTRGGKAAEFTAKVGTDAEETAAKVKSETEAKEESYGEMIAKVKAEVADAMAKVTTETEKVIAKAEAEEKADIYAKSIKEAKAKAQIEAKLRAEAEEKLRAETEARLKAEQKAQAEVEKRARFKAELKAKTVARAEKIAKANAKVEKQAYVKAILRVTAEAANMVAKIKAQTRAEAEEMIARVKTEARQKAKAEAAETTIANKRAELEAQATRVTALVNAETTDMVAKVKAETEEAIAKVKTEAEDAIAKVRAEVEEETRVYIDTTAKVKAEEKATIRNEGKEQPVSETIQRITQPPAVLPSEHARQTSTLCTKDIMQKEPVWGSPDDSVQQAFAKVQQHDAGYMLVGRNGVLEGIVSRSDLTGAISPYLRPIFSKWRRPMDDATLQIRIKWIMSRPVHIISPQMPLGAIMRNMCRSRVRALPVADQQGKVLGLVTETNIFKAILKLKSDPNVPASDKGYQEQSASPQAPEHTRTQPIINLQKT